MSESWAAWESRIKLKHKCADLIGNDRLLDGRDAFYHKSMRHEFEQSMQRATQIMREGVERIKRLLPD